ncbi:MAG: dTDP-4-dehydrorhamnose reductase [Pseudomonadota bacterium]|nr:dTDP-4-dehydrorhamnose reductase [Pseudomonadota bacterium]
MRILVTGTQGQVARSLIERAPPGVEVVALGRPQLDLADPASIRAAFDARDADVVINAAAYTAVDKAETEEALATRINGDGAGLVAECARALGAPIIQLSTDYVFDGALDRPYREDDPVNPIGAYGRSKLCGEEAVASANPRHAILRTAWVYSPFGTNFVKTMLRLGESRSEVRVVADQRGGPTSALDIADALFAVATLLVARPAPERYGVFHMTGEGEASWAEFAESVFAQARALGRPAVKVIPIATADYPTPARRPANSRLDGGRLARDYGVALPPWRDSLGVVVERLLAG